ncbi:hypothetical protein ERJ75_001377800 [Trypanosoma vivax]|nr:hypothetical protein ERJ75_001377800 [Trypanosoma vivax]
MAHLRPRKAREVAWNAAKREALRGSGFVVGKKATPAIFEKEGPRHTGREAHLRQRASHTVGRDDEEMDKHRDCDREGRGTEEDKRTRWRLGRCEGKACRGWARSEHEFGKGDGRGRRRRRPSRSDLTRNRRKIDNKSATGKTPAVDMGSTTCADAKRGGDWKGASREQTRSVMGDRKPVEITRRCRKDELQKQRHPGGDLVVRGFAGRSWGKHEVPRVGAKKRR